MITVKATYLDETRRVPLSRLPAELTYDELCIMLARVFKHRGADTAALALKYVDEDGDLVVLDSDDDIAHALAQASVLRVRMADTLPAPQPGRRPLPLDALRADVAAARARLDAVIAVLDAHARDDTDGKPADGKAITKRLSTAELAAFEAPKPRLPATSESAEPASPAESKPPPPPAAPALSVPPASSAPIPASPATSQHSSAPALPPRDAQYPPPPQSQYPQQYPAPRQQQHQHQQPLQQQQQYAYPPQQQQQYPQQYAPQYRPAPAGQAGHAPPPPPNSYAPPPAPQQAYARPPPQSSYAPPPPPITTTAPSTAYSYAQYRPPPPQQQ